MPRSEEEIEDLVTLGFDFLDAKDGKEKNISKAYECFSTAAKYGNVTAQSQLSFMYYYSEYGNNDLEKARYWAEKAALQGDGISAATLGEMFEYGEGVTEDLAQAAYWYEKAVQFGFVAAKKPLKRLQKLGHIKPEKQKTSKNKVGCVAAKKQPKGLQKSGNTNTQNTSKSRKKFLFFEFDSTDTLFVRIFTVVVSFIIYGLILAVVGVIIWGIVWLWKTIL